jgi:hypothetical protein
MKSYLRNILPALLIITLIVLSCSGRKNRAEHKDLIPDKDLISVLTDVYMADGLLSLPKINRNYAGIDSVTAYKQVIERHGYTQAQFNRTVRFYFIKKPKKFIKIYDKVLGRLSEMESRMEKEHPFMKPDQSNMWLGRSNYMLPVSSAAENPEVNFQVPVSGFYTLKFTLTLYPDDRLIHPHLDLYIYSADSLETGQKHYFPSLSYIKDGRPHSYKSTLIIRNPGKRLFIKGWFIQRECLDPEADLNLSVENIILSRSPIE